MIDFLDDPLFDRTRAGKKAAHLHTIALAGHRVPPGFVVPAGDDLALLSDEELAAAVDRIGGYPVAVRSSGVLEDLAGASFAGQYETFLDVGDLGALKEKIAACRASAKTERVLAYLAKQKLSPQAAAVAVLVQKMVPARVAGVGFSIHPLTGREEHALVECCHGLGEKLVSGHVQPTRFVLAIESGAVVEREAGGEDVQLSGDEARALVTALLDLQALFGAPQDVEFAFDGGGALHLLQSRPVTKIAWRTDVDEFTNADFKDGGISARVCTPMMYALYRDALQDSMQRYFESLKLVDRRAPAEAWIASFYGRGYWNASAVKRALSRIPGFSEEKFDQDLGIQKSYGKGGGMVVPTTIKTVAQALPVALALERSYKAQLELVREFPYPFRRERRAWQDRIRAFATTPDATFFGDLARAFGELHARTEKAYFTTIYNNANAQSDFKSFLAGMDAAVGRETSIIRLMGGLSDVHHMDIQRGFLRLYDVARAHGFEGEEWRRAVEAFLEHNGYHADAELDLTVPRWSEVPERVRAHVENYLKSGAPPADPDATVVSQRRAFLDEVKAIEARLASKVAWRVRFAFLFRRHLTRVRAYLSAREEMREYSTQTYAIVRSYVVEAGVRFARRGDLGAPEDVFMLHTDEALALSRGALSREKARATAAHRRKLYDGYRDLVPPNELGRGVEVRTEETFDGHGALRGLGCSPGVVEGIVRVVASLDDAHTIRQGDILVTRFTDPGWTPVLGLVSGIVTEVGGLLSHAAVIGREYGIPAILNLPGATRTLKTGQRIRIDGGTGLVELLGEQAAA